MKIELNGFVFELSLSAYRHHQWHSLPLTATAGGATAELDGLTARLALFPQGQTLAFDLSFKSDYATRVRLQAAVADADDAFHLIPGNIHGDNNAAHVRPGEFPCLTTATPHLRNCSPIWEFRADRASHPVSMVCTKRGAVAVSITPYSPCDEIDGGNLRNGAFAALPASCGVSVGYGNDPMTFSEKTLFYPAVADLCHGATASGNIFAIAGEGRQAAHKVIRHLHARYHDRPVAKKKAPEALRALADSFAEVNYSPVLKQYTNRKCFVPTDTELKPWRVISEIGWTGGSMMAYPFVLAEHAFPDLKMPKTGEEIFDQICTGYNEASGFINDCVVNRFTENLPDGWRTSDLNGWWSGFLPQTLDNHCAYNNAHAAFYLLRTVWAQQKWGKPLRQDWIDTARRVLDTAVALQREDGAFGYIFSSTEKKVVDWEGFAGCWFVPALAIAWKLTGHGPYLDAAKKAIAYYHPAVRDLAAWGSPMDTYKSIDSEGNLAFVRSARLLHEFTGEAKYLEMLQHGAEYEYLWRYGFRTRPQAPPLKGSDWNSCGGSITSVSNPHLHPMSVVIHNDLLYLARVTGDDYHKQRAQDTHAWLLNTMELYPAVTGYGRYGVLSERTCPSDGLLAERFSDTGLPASTWWSYNAWAAASAMEALAEHVLGERGELPEGAGR
ncbi:MAG: hypothetical protein JWM57_1540 [Phycisphaerales bacterium]|nr:hypothetical protein [Phycisphaerales bacterium]